MWTCSRVEGTLNQKVVSRPPVLRFPQWPPRLALEVSPPLLMLSRFD